MCALRWIKYLRQVLYDSLKMFAFLIPDTHSCVPRAKFSADSLLLFSRRWYINEGRLLSDICLRRDIFLAPFLCQNSEIRMKVVHHLLERVSLLSQHCWLSCMKRALDWLPFHALMFDLFYNNCKRRELRDPLQHSCRVVLVRSLVNCCPNAMIKAYETHDLVSYVTVGLIIMIYIHISIPVIHLLLWPAFVLH